MPEFENALAGLKQIQALLLRPGVRSLEGVLEPMERACQAISLMKGLTMSEKKVLEQQMQTNAALMESAWKWQQGWAERIQAWRSEAQSYDGSACLTDRTESGPRFVVQG